MARVLIADTDPSLCATLGKALRAERLEVKTCESGKEALAQLSMVYFEVAVLDFRLRDLGGVEVLRTIREKEIQTDIVITSDQATIEQAVQAVKAGSQDFLQKPIETTQFTGLVHCLLERRRFSPHYLADRLDAYTRQHLGQASLTMENLCGHFCISRGYASRLFRTYLGTSFRARLVQYRVKQAKHMLESTDQPLYLIAEQCGFKSQCRLTDVFCQQEGMPPKKYREVHKNS